MLGRDPGPGRPVDGKAFSLGGFMTRQDSLRLQKKARAQGLARDVFVHNYVA